MFDITWQFGNFLMGILGSFMAFAVIILIVWLLWVFARRMHLYLQENKKITFMDVLQVLFAGFLLFSLSIANANAPKVRLQTDNRDINKRLNSASNPTEIINLAPNTTSSEERNTEQRNLDTETNKRTINNK